MNIYKGLLFLDGFRIPAEYAEDVADTVPDSRRPPDPPAKRPAAATESRVRRSLRRIATVGGLVGPRAGQFGRCG